MLKFLSIMCSIEINTIGWLYTIIVTVAAQFAQIGNKRPLAIIVCSLAWSTLRSYRGIASAAA